METAPGDSRRLFAEVRPWLLTGRGGILTRTDENAFIYASIEIGDGVRREKKTSHPEADHRVSRQAGEAPVGDVGHRRAAGEGIRPDHVAQFQEREAARGDGVPCSCGTRD